MSTPDAPPQIAGGSPLAADAKVVVVGASLAGLRCAEGLRDEGFAGRIVLVGGELHLPDDRPPLSKQVLAGTWPPERVVLGGREKLHALGVEAVVGHPATALDAEAARVTLSDATVLEGDAVVVATGAFPRHLPGTEGLEGVTVLRTLDDCLALRDRVTAHGEGLRVVVIGAGFIGSEVAATLSTNGAQVTVVEAMPVPLANALGEPVGAACAQLHARNGVELRTGTGVAAVHPPGSRRADDVASEGAEGTAGAVELTDGSVLPADVVVVGVGVTPATDWLDGSGLEVANGVVCGPSLFCAPRVVAAGDVARWWWRRHGVEESVRIEHWEVASQMGGAAARSLLAGPRAAPDFDPVPYFWSDQYGLRIQVLGRPAPTDEVVVVDGSYDAADGRFVCVYGTDGRFTAVLGVSRPRQVMAFRPLLERGARFSEALGLLSS